MEDSTKLRAQTKLRVSCEICDTVLERDIFYCETCLQDFCKLCKASHLKASVSRDHKFISYEEKIKRGRVTESLCSKHKRPYYYFCESCNKKSCIDCLPQFHRQHDFLTLSECEKLYKESFEAKLRTKGDELSPMLEIIRTLEEEEKACRKQSSKTKTAIQCRSRQLQAEIKSIENELIKEISETERSILVDIHKMKDPLNDTKKKYDDLSRRYRDRNVADFDLITFVQKEEEILESIQVPSTVKCNSKKLPTFTYPTDQDNLNRNFGTLDNCFGLAHEVNMQAKGTALDTRCSELETLDPAIGATNVEPLPGQQIFRNKLQIITKKRIAAGKIYDISIVGKNDAWIYKQNGLMFVGENGDILNEIRLTGYVADSTKKLSRFEPNSALFAANSLIMKVDFDKKVSTIADLTPYLVHGVYYDNTSKTIWASLRKAGTHGKLVQLSASGHTLQEYEKTENGLTLFQNPQNVNSPGKNQLCVLKTDRPQGVVLVRQNQDNSTSISSNEFKVKGNISSMTCDAKGNLICCEGTGNQIHILDKTGNPLHNFKHEFASVSGIDTDTRGRLWLVSHSGELIVCEYLN